MNPFAGTDPFAPNGGSPVLGLQNGNRLVQYSNDMSKPFILVAGDFQFEIWQNNANQFCSLGVKPAALGIIIPIIVSMTAYYNGNIQTVVNKFNNLINNAETDKSDYAVIDNDVGYGSGGAHSCFIMREDTGEPYRLFTCSTSNDANEVTVAAMVVEWGGYPGSLQK